MGTTIHTAIERRINGKWELVTDKLFVDAGDSKTATAKPITGENSYLFDILLGKEDVLVKGIDTQKGYPNDLSPELKNTIGRYKDKQDFPTLSGCFGGSWIGLDELLRIDWTASVENTTVVSLEDYRRHRNDRKYESLNGDLKDRILISDYTADLICNHLLYPVKGKKFAVAIKDRSKWTVADRTGNIVSEVLPTMASLVPEDGLNSDVRLVFDFNEQGE